MILIFLIAHCGVGLSPRAPSSVAPFNTWLKKSLISSDAVALREDWALITTKRLRAGDVAMEIPASLCLTAESARQGNCGVLLEAAEETLGEDFPAYCGEASLIALQFLFGDVAREWKDCIAVPETLPLLDDGNLNGYSSRGFEALRDNAKDDVKWLQSAGVSDIDWETYREWVAVALSRSFVVGTGELVCAPGLDFCNHDDVLDPMRDDPLSRVLRKSTVRGDKKFVLEVPDDLDKGQEVKLSYGTLPAAAYLETYGFLPRKSAARRQAATCELRFDFTPDDRFLDDKRDIMEQHSTTDGFFFDENDGIQVAVGGEPDPEYFRFARLKFLSGTDSFLLEPLFSTQIWDFLALPISKQNEQACLDALKGECLATKNSLLLEDSDEKKKDAPLSDLLDEVRQIEIKALDATLNWVSADIATLDSKEYYQERRLRDLGLDTEWSAEESQWSGSRTPGGVDW